MKHTLSTFEAENRCLDKLAQSELKQGRIHGYLSRVWLGWGSIKSLLASKQQNTQLRIR